MRERVLCDPRGFARVAQSVFDDDLIASLAQDDSDARLIVGMQRAAVTLLLRLVETSVGELLFEQLPLLLRLRLRQRVAEQLWTSRIEPVLLSPRFRDSRWHGTKLPDAAARAFAYRLVLQADPDRSEEVLRNACADSHPKVALIFAKNWNSRFAIHREVQETSDHHKALESNQPIDECTSATSDWGDHEAFITKRTGTRFLRYQ